MPRPPAKCGTDSGYTKHLRNKQEPCADCRKAHAEGNRRRAGSNKCGTDCGYYRHRKRGEDACADCKAAHAAAVKCSRCRRSGVTELPPERPQSREPVAWKPRKGILVPVYEESEVA